MPHYHDFNCMQVKLSASLNALTFSYIRNYIQQNEQSLSNEIILCSSKFSQILYLCEVYFYKPLTYTHI